MIRKSTNLTKLSALPVVLIASAFGSIAATQSIPLSKGTVWIYEGTVAWSDGTRVKRKRIRVATEIIETINYPPARVAVVRSFPSELAWYGDKPHPMYSLLVLSKEGLYEIEPKDQEDAHLLARKFGEQVRELMLRADTIIPFPLSEGRRFRSSVKGFPLSKHMLSYQNVHRTNPDHSIADFVPGLGIVRYRYEHHGTVSSVDVELKEIRHTRRKS